MGRHSKLTKMQVRFFKILLKSGFTEVTLKIHPEYKYSEAELADYALMMKRAFKKGTYFINCDYGSAGIQVGDYHKKIGFDNISDKLIALVIYHSRLKSANSRYKFGYYAYKVSDLNDVYDAIMTSYPYHNPSKACKQSIEDARIQLPIILEQISSFKD